MGFSRLIKFALAASMLLGFTALPCRAQSFPSYFPTQSNYNQTTVSTTIQNDFIVTGNSWVFGTLGIQANSLNFSAIEPITTLGQNTIFILPDPGVASDTLLTAAATQTLTGQVTFTVAPIAPGYVLTGTSHNATLQVIQTLGQATTFSLPDPASATDTIMTLKPNQTVVGIKTFNRNDLLATIGTGTATYNPSGRLFSLSAVQSSATGAAVNTTYTLPANSLTTTGQGIRVKIHGTTASNSNTKACNFLFGSAPVTITLPLSTGSAKDFYAEILIYRTGTSAQEISVQGYANNAVINGLSTTATATETGTIACELNIPISTGAADVVVDEFTITAEQ